VTLIGGQLVAVGIQLLLQHFVFTEAELKEWGWRVPFVIGALLSVIAFYLRSSLEETASFRQVENKKQKGTIRELLRYPRAILTVAGLTLGGTVAFYTFSVYMQKYLTNTLHLSTNHATTILFVCLLVFAFLQPVFGSLSDRIGRKPLLIAFGVIGTMATVPILTGLQTAQSETTIYLLVMAGLMIVSGYTSINAVVKAELFPAQIRALGVGLPYALTAAIFGGTAEYIALWFKKAGNENYFFWYVTICIFISLIVYVSMGDTKKNSKIEA
jgi:MHS family alpha-ketoglutarate permease-like MFS transporter